MNLMPLAWAFPAWKCNRCRQTVEWVDAICVDTPELFAVLHADCVEGEQ